ncbi:hypothetical protein ACJJIF_01020 [Microbulbifer sp. SSSA002]|uniref:hypothetical protein n=1 Tax=Microbulbifer sp. SSSA002 TaxID=3243376 RepID=UPI004039AE31
MRSLSIILFFTLLSATVSAHEHYPAAEEIRLLKKEVIQLRKEMRVDHKQSASAENVRDLEREVARLRKNIHQLQDVILELQASIEAQSQVVQPLPVVERPKWTCYMKDARAGGIHVNGFSRIEAKGKLLETCTQRGGVCFESGIKCSE